MILLAGTKYVFYLTWFGIRLLAGCNRQGLTRKDGIYDPHRIHGDAIRAVLCPGYIPMPNGKCAKRIGVGEVHCELGWCAGDRLHIHQTSQQHLGGIHETVKSRSQAKPCKCKLAKWEVEFLGYVVSEHGFLTDTKKVTAITNYPQLKDLKSPWAFYYRQIVPCFSSIAQLLYKLSHKEVPSEWQRNCEASFVQLKGLLTQPPILAYPSFGKDFLLETDVSWVVLDGDWYCSYPRPATANAIRLCSWITSQSSRRSTQLKTRWHPQWQS